MATLSPHEPFRFTAQPSAGSASGSVSGEDAVNQTRREIQRLVREASDLVHNARDAQTFWPAYLERVLQATAATAVSVWTPADNGPVERNHVGGKYDAHFNATSRACHHQLIDEVAAKGEPVLVPPTAECDDPTLSLNPTTSLALLVPILVDGRSEAVLQVLMPTGGGLATQRGYLRFAAQMGDLAGEFLRTETLRRVRRDEQAWSRLARNVAGIHRSLSYDAAAAAIVDLAAETFDIDRVSLLRREGSHWRVVTISGVPDFDIRSPTVKALAAYVGRRRDGNPEPVWDVESIDDEADIIPVAGLLPLGPSGALLLQSMQGPVTPDQQQRWLTFADHASAAWGNADRFDAIPCASLQAQLFTAGGRFEGARRKLMLIGTAAVLLAAVAMLPVPMVVSATAKLEPLDQQIVYAPRDAVVTHIRVRHGDTVQAGDILAQLVDAQLDQAIDDCLGQQNVLDERHRELKSLMISMAGKPSEERERIEGEFRVVQQKIHAAGQQLKLAQQQREQLTLRAAQSGQVVGWRVQQELADRPVRRSQQLLQVVAPDGRWVMCAAVPQERIDHVLQTAGANDDPVDVDVIFRSFPSRPVRGQLQRVGLAAVENRNNETMGMAMVSVPTEDLPIREPGATATVAIPCGRKPLVYVAFQDLIRVVSEAIHVYL